jgi:hypothetical protein
LLILGRTSAFCFGGKLETSDSGIHIIRKQKFRKRQTPAYIRKENVVLSHSPFDDAETILFVEQVEIFIVESETTLLEVKGG